jgi:hypothetical protein
VIEAVPGDLVAWLYADPRGGEHHSLNCSVSELRVVLDDRELVTPHGGVYEHGTTDTGHGVPVQPFSDG